MTELGPDSDRPSTLIENVATPIASATMLPRSPSWLKRGESTQGQQHSPSIPNASQATVNVRASKIEVGAGARRAIRDVAKLVDVNAVQTRRETSDSALEAHARGHLKRT